MALSKIKKSLGEIFKGGKRQFNGKVFSLRDFANTQMQAKERAEKLRKKGYKTRITYNRNSKEYDIWARR